MDRLTRSSDSELPEAAEPPSHTVIVSHGWGAPAQDERPPVTAVPEPHAPLEVCR